MNKYTAEEIEECAKAAEGFNESTISQMLRDYAALLRASVDPAAIAEQVMYAWDDRVPQYSFDFRGLIIDRIQRAMLAAAAKPED